jgi:hypothetical protein
MTLYGAGRAPSRAVHGVVNRGRRSCGDVVRLSNATSAHASSPIVIVAQIVIWGTRLTKI